MITVARRRDRPPGEGERCPCGNPHDGWPGDGDDQLCQECWEAYCDRTWWEMVVALDTALAAGEEG